MHSIAAKLCRRFSWALLISLTEVTIFLSASFVNCVFFLAAGHLLEMDAAWKDSSAA